MQTGNHSMKTHLLILSLILGMVSCSSTPFNGSDTCPEGALASQTCTAISHQPAMGGLFAWAEGDKLWNDDIVTVSFMNGTQGQINQAWLRFAVVDGAAPGLQFRKVQRDGQIRVGFGCGGHWSYLGTDALRQPKTKQTMNLQLSDRSSSREWDRVTIHEVLHAIALGHEHQHPDGNIPWNRERVLQFYRSTQGWSDDQIEYQVLRSPSIKDLRTTGFRTDSIMAYPIPAELTDGKMVVGWNHRFTKEDRQLVAELYP
jgi:serralysin